MEAYCVSCKKYTANENSSVRKTRQNRVFSLKLFVALKNQLLLKIKNFQMINLK